MAHPPAAPGPLRLAGLTVRAGGQTLLDQVDLVLHPGELVALVGPSGAGKSTLFKVVLGVRRPDGGAVRLGDGAIGDAGPVGYVPQDDALHGALTVRQALGFAARLRLPDGDPAAHGARIDAVVQTVGLAERLDVRIRRLSGGQRKRVSVALELLTAPRLLVLDEPTSGLDPGLEARMMGLFADLAAGGRVVLVSTHAVASLHRCAVLVVLVQGRVAYAGPPDGAPAWFEAPDHARMFDRIAARAPLVWGKRWLQSRECRAFLARPAPAPPSAPARVPALPPAPPGAAPPKPTAADQLAALKAARAGGESS